MYATFSLTVNLSNLKMYLFFNDLSIFIGDYGYTKRKSTCIMQIANIIRQWLHGLKMKLPKIEL